MKKPSNYYCKRGVFQQLQINGDRKVQIVQKIGQGSFGEVYKIFDSNSSSLAVVKKMKKQTMCSQQSKILQNFSNSEGFNRLKMTNITDTPSSQKNDSIIMGCLGPNLGSIMKKNKKLNIYSMKKIAYQLIKNLKQLHCKYYVHRDIKPDNILIGNKYDSHSIYLIDFGLATTFKKSAVKARKVMEGAVGTVKFCSISSHLGIQQYPKDDLQSLGYVLLYLVKGHLKWDGLKAQSNEQLFQAILKQKKSCSIQQLCQGVNSLRKYWTIVKRLGIQQKINYDQLFQIFDVGDKNLLNCFQFCQNCWIRNIQDNSKQNCQQILQPKPNKVRSSILN